MTSLRLTSPTALKSSSTTASPMARATVLVM
jgi:hypothetical protein